MTALTASLLVIGGLAALAAGGELLVRGAVNLARLAGLTPAVIGLTVVAIGTSLPELTVSVIAAREGRPDLSVGNVVGSNIFNIAGVLGIAALLAPLEVIGSAVRREWPMMFVASVGFPIVAWDGTISRAEGAVALVGLIAFLAYSVRIARREVAGSEEEQFTAAVARRGGALATLRSVVRPVAFVVAGLLALIWGGDTLVAGASALARLWGMSERVIGLTIVAVGTGTPELATTAAAVLRRHADVAVANMVGSSIFNLLGILGFAAVLTPITISPALLGSDVWWMIGTAAVLFPVMRSGFRITRREGMLLLALYGVYLVLLLRAPDA